MFSCYWYKIKIIIITILNFVHFTIQWLPVVHGLHSLSCIGKNQYFRNRNMLFCNLFIYHLPPYHSVRKRRFILKSVLKWKKCPFSILTHFYFPDTHSLKTECQNASFKTAIIVSQNSIFFPRKQGTDRLFPLVNVIILFIDNLFIYLLRTWICKF